jgi:hypothetical protein
MNGINRRPPPPPPLQVTIIATSEKFHVRGQPAVVGQLYTLDCDIAAGLVAIGKAKPT